MTKLQTMLKDLSNLLKDKESRNNFYPKDKVDGVEYQLYVTDELISLILNFDEKPLDDVEIKLYRFVNAEDCLVVYTSENRSYFPGIYDILVEKIYEKELAK